MRYVGYSMSNGGKIRSNNEDNMFLDGKYRKDLKLFSWEYDSTTRDGILAAVFDGIGGADKGELASFIAADELAHFPDKPIDDGLLQYIHQTNRRIWKEADGNQMGATSVILFIFYNMCWFNNMGDSQGFLFRNGVLKKMTKDHNMVTELYEEGILTLEQARKHPQRHAIYQFLGMKDEDDDIFEPYEHYAFPVKEGDYFLLCTDGLTDMVEPERIQEILSEDERGVLDPQIIVKQKVMKLLEEALNNGGRDNVTVVLIKALDKQ